MAGAMVKKKAKVAAEVAVEEAAVVVECLAG